MSSLSKLREIIENAEKTVFFGGAGVSVDSGIPDFRSAGGLYSEDNGDGTFTTSECTGDGPMIAEFWNNNAITWINNGDGTITPVGYAG